MKAMQKVRRGRGFRGLLNYVLERGPVIGGNMTGLDPRSLASEFGQTRRLRPDVEKPVWHSSLRLPPGETIDPSRFSDIADKFMARLGFSPSHPRVYVLHDDMDGQHIHIVANRIGVDSSLYLGQNENLKATRLVVELEREHGLTITPGPKLDPETGKIVMPERRRISKDEQEMSERTGKPPGRDRLQNAIDTAVAGKPSTATFLERLESSGVTARPNLASTGKMNGFSFEVEGIAFSGSQLGSRYKWASLQTQIDYEPTRDRDILDKQKSKSKTTAIIQQNDNAIRPAPEPQPTRDPTGGAHPENGDDFARLAADISTKTNGASGFVGSCTATNLDRAEQHRREADKDKDGHFAIAQIARRCAEGFVRAVTHRRSRGLKKGADRGAERLGVRLGDREAVVNRCTTGRDRLLDRIAGIAGITGRIVALLSRFGHSTIGAVIADWIPWKRGKLGLPPHPKWPGAGESPDEITALPPLPPSQGRGYGE